MRGALMKTTETSWYELIGQDNAMAVNRLVQCDNFATVISIEEMKDVAIECVVPMTKMSYQITDHQDKVFKEGGTVFIIQSFKT